MANVSAVYPPEFWAQEGLILLENNKVIANQVHRNFEPIVAEQGDTIHTRSRALITISDKANDGSAVTFTAPDATDVAIELRYHTVAPFFITDRDFQTSISSLVDDFVQPAIIPISNLVDTRLLDGDLSGFPSDGHGLMDPTLVGRTATGSQFDLSTLAGLRAAMRANQVPLSAGSVNLILGTQHEGEALAEPNFVSADFTGDSAPAIQTGVLGQKLGINIFGSQNVTSNTASGDRSVAFHRQAMTLVTRPLAAPPRDMGVRSGVVEKDGLGIRVVMSWDHDTFSWKISYDLLWGFRLLNGNLAQRVTDSGT